MTCLEAVVLTNLRTKLYVSVVSEVLTIIKKRNNWSTPPSFGQGSGFDARDKNLVKTKHLTYLLPYLLGFMVFNIFAILSRI